MQNFGVETFHKQSACMKRRWYDKIKMGKQFAEEESG